MALIGPMKYLTIGGKTYEIESSGGTVTSVTAGTGLSGGTITGSGTISLDTSRALSVSDIQTGTDTTNKLISAKTFADVVGSLGGGTVTSVGAQNATNGGLSISGSPITTSGTITIGHSNVLTSAQTTQAVYPIKIDKNGHISAYGSAVTIPVVPDETENATTGISIANHATGSVTGVQSTTTTASHVKSGGNGTAPTLGTAFSVPNVTAAGSGSFTQGSFNGGSFTQGTDSFTANTPTAINTSKFSGGSFTQGTDSFTKPTHAADSFTPASLQSGFYTAGTATTPTVIDTSKFSGGSYSHTGFSGGSFTRGTFSGGSLTMTMDTTDTKKLNITFTAATHANDSFTAATYGTDSFTAASLASGFYTAGTKGTPTTIDTSKFSGGSFTQGTFTQGSFTQGTDSFTAASLQSGFYTAGTAASFTQGEDSFTPATHGADSHIHTPPTLGTKFTIPNVTSAGSASNWVFEDVTVPIKNTSASTFVTGTTHTITDNGHTHSI